MAITHSNAAARRSARPVRPDELGDTRLRILDTAETLFARDGVDKVSLRTVTMAAGVNVAAVHYHFGSKDELLREIFVRRMTPLIEERLRRLAGCDAASEPSMIEQIVAAYVEPAFEFDCSHNEFGFNRLLARLSLDYQQGRTNVFQFVQFEADSQFVAALADAAPRFSRTSLMVRLELLLGMIVQAITMRAHLARTKTCSVQALVEELISAGSAIFQAGAQA